MRWSPRRLHQSQRMVPVVRKRRILRCKDRLPPVVEDGFLRKMKIASIQSRSRVRRHRNEHHYRPDQLFDKRFLLLALLVVGAPRPMLKCLRADNNGSNPRLKTGTNRTGTNQPVCPNDPRALLLLQVLLLPWHVTCPGYRHRRNDPPWLRERRQWVLVHPNNLETASNTLT